MIATQLGNPQICLVALALAMARSPIGKLLGNVFSCLTYSLQDFRAKRYHRVMKENARDRPSKVLDDMHTYRPTKRVV